MAIQGDVAWAPDQRGVELSDATMRVINTVSKEDAGRFTQQQLAAYQDLLKMFARGMLVPGRQKRGNTYLDRIRLTLKELYEIRMGHPALPTIQDAMQMASWFNIEDLSDPLAWVKRVKPHLSETSADTNSKHFINCVNAFLREYRPEGWPAPSATLVQALTAGKLVNRVGVKAAAAGRARAQAEAAEAAAAEARVAAAAAPADQVARDKAAKAAAAAGAKRKRAELYTGTNEPARLEADDVATRQAVGLYENAKNNAQVFVREVNEALDAGKMEEAAAAFRKVLLAESLFGEGMVPMRYALGGVGGARLLVDNGLLLERNPVEYDKRVVSKMVALEGGSDDASRGNYVAVLSDRTVLRIGRSKTNPSQGNEAYYGGERPYSDEVHQLALIFVKRGLLEPNSELMRTEAEQLATLQTITSWVKTRFTIKAWWDSARHVFVKGPVKLMSAAEQQRTAQWMLHGTGAREATYNAVDLGVWAAHLPGPSAAAAAPEEPEEVEASEVSEVSVMETEAEAEVSVSEEQVAVETEAEAEVPPAQQVAAAEPPTVDPGSPVLPRAAVVLLEAAGHPAVVAPCAVRDRAPGSVASVTLEVLRARYEDD